MPSGRDTSTVTGELHEIDIINGFICMYMRQVNDCLLEYHYSKVFVKTGKSLKYMEVYADILLLFDKFNLTFRSI